MGILFPYATLIKQSIFLLPPAADDNITVHEALVTIAGERTVPITETHRFHDK